MPDPPTGTVTFFFTDIEGSTHLLQHLGDERYAEVLADQRRIMRAALARWRGHEFRTEGDAFLVAFSSAADAAGAAAEALQALGAHTWPDGAPVRVRVGLHTGQTTPIGGGYIGLEVHRTNRVMGAAYGGQVLLSQATRDELNGTLSAGLALRDLGEHRLKDLTHTEHLYQLVIPGLPEYFPPPKTLNVVSHNLPGQQTSFIGRDREIEEVKLQVGASRLVTLMGPGGAGKTRLAIQVAANLLEEFKHGAWLVDLSPLRDPAFVVQTIAATLGVREVAGRALLDSLIDYLQPKTLLLVVDNCEHLVESCAATLGVLLRMCPNLRVLATSRDALGVAGEATYRIPPLARPDARRRYSLAELAEFAAVRLFIERAELSDPLFALNESTSSPVARITQRLDGIPLAIELAAAQLSILSAEEIDARLSDRFLLLTGGRGTLPHHQTLRATIDWSYDLLPDTDRPLFRRLSVFNGGFVLDAAEEICGGGEVDVVDLLDGLTRLVDKSLVVAESLDGSVRYRMLETVREYGQEKLEESDEDAVFRDRHMAWFLGVAEQNEAMLRGPEQIRALDVLERDVDNLRAGLEWSRAHRDPADSGLRFASALHRFWLLRGYLSEGREWLETLLQASSNVDPLVRAKALYGAAVLAAHQGDYARTDELTVESLAIYRGAADHRGTALSLNVLGNTLRRKSRFREARGPLEESLSLSRDPWARAEALNILGLMARQQRDYAEAERLLNESLALWRQIGDKSGLAAALVYLGSVARQVADYDRARSLMEEGLALRRELGDQSNLGSSLINLGIVALDQGDLDRALPLFEEALQLSRDLGNKTGMAASLASLGWIVAQHRGDYDRARQLLEEGIAIGRDLGDRLQFASSLRILGAVEHSQGHGERALQLLAESLQLTRDLSDKVGIAECLEFLAPLAVERGKAGIGARLLGAAEVLREATRNPLPVADVGAYQRTFSAVRSALSESDFHQAWAEGRAMPLEDAIRLAEQVTRSAPVSAASPQTA